MAGNEGVGVEGFEPGVVGFWFALFLEPAVVAQAVVGLVGVEFFLAFFAFGHGDLSRCGCWRRSS